MSETLENAQEPPRPNPRQRRWLARGLDQPGGKLPLFDGDGRRISRRTVEACVRAGWAEPWFDNPLKPDWLVCRLTEAGRASLDADDTNLGRRGENLGKGLT